MVEAAAGLGFIQGYSKGKPPAERLEVVKLFVELGADVNAADDYGITPLMAAANMGDTTIIQYLVDAGADLGAYDLGKKNDGAFGASVEPLMPVDYAIGVGTFVPNNAVIIHEDAVALMTRLMKERGIAHPRRSARCAASPARRPTSIRKSPPRPRSPGCGRPPSGHQVTGVTGGLEVKRSQVIRRYCRAYITHAVESRCAAAETGARTVLGIRPAELHDQLIALQDELAGVLGVGARSRREVERADPGLGNLQDVEGAVDAAVRREQVEVRRRRERAAADPPQRFTWNFCL